MEGAIQGGIRTETEWKRRKMQELEKNLKS